MASDNFTNSSGTLLATHNPLWANVTASKVVSNFHIVDNAAKIKTNYANAGARYLGSLADESQVTFCGMAAADVNRFVCVRSSGTGEGYSARFHSAVGGNWTALYCLKNSTFLGGFGTGAWPVISGHVMRIWITGSGATTTIHGSVDGLEVGTGVVDSTPLGSGNPGFHGTANSSTADFIFDDWTDNQVLGPQRYWLGTTSTNSQVAANWSGSSGGTGGASVPSEVSPVYFDGGSTNKDCNLTSNVRWLSLTAESGYLGTLDASGCNVTVIGDVILDSNTVKAGSGVWIVGGNFDYKDVTNWNTGTAKFIFTGTNKYLVGKSFTYPLYGISISGDATYVVVSGSIFAGASGITFGSSSNNLTSTSGVAWGVVDGGRLNVSTTSTSTIIVIEV